mgnify:CR=1 FL=1|tara:strand:+ start:30 stop:518 length:489 start_codon:yes stop_codon:yes gene_type:complete
MFKVIDNFLSDKEHLTLKYQMEEAIFPWYFEVQSIPNTTNKRVFHFNHNFYRQENGGYVNSDFFNIIKPLISKLKVNTLVRVKANLNTIEEKLIKSDAHCDQRFDCKVAIYYMGTNNGYTKIGDKKVECVKNRIVLFNSKTIHYGTNCTDEQRRILININYF